jgi:hypothetical protein
MKKLQLSFVSFFSIAMAINSTAQIKEEKIMVWGECTTCQFAIEKAAKSTGASYASWDWYSQTLSVKYHKDSSSTISIQKAVAKIGYDTKEVKADDEVFNNLHYCCKYERTRETGKRLTCCLEPECKEAQCKPDAKGERPCCKKTNCLKAECKRPV